MKHYPGDLFDVPVTIQDTEESARDCMQEWYGAGIQLVNASGNALAAVMYDNEVERIQRERAAGGPFRPGLTFEEAKQVAEELKPVLERVLAARKEGAPER